MRVTIEVSWCRERSSPESGVVEWSWVCGQFYRVVGILSLQNGNCIGFKRTSGGFCVCGRGKSSNYKRVAAEAFKGFLVLCPVSLPHVC